MGALIITSIEYMEKGFRFSQESNPVPPNPRPLGQEDTAVPTRPSYEQL